MDIVRKVWSPSVKIAGRNFYPCRSIRRIRGIEVIDMTAKVDSKMGKIQEYRVCVKLSFGVER